MPRRCPHDVDPLPRVRRVSACRQRRDRLRHRAGPAVERQRRTTTRSRREKAPRATRHRSCGRCRVDLLRRERPRVRSPRGPGDPRLRDGHHQAHRHRRHQPDPRRARRRDGAHAPGARPARLDLEGLQALRRGIRRARSRESRRLSRRGHLVRPQARRRRAQGVRGRRRPWATARERGRLGPRDRSGDLERQAAGDGGFVRSLHRALGVVLVRRRLEPTLLFALGNGALRTSGAQLECWLWRR